MANQEKEDLCQFMASLFSPPNEELAKEIHRGSVHSFFREVVLSLEDDTALLNGLLMEGEPGAILNDLDQAYERLFSGLCEESIPLVESFYKPWTRDTDCTLPFASATGLLMGDPAIHLSELYRQCGLDMSEEFRGRPDHLVLEMEFLSYLYRWGADIEARQFIEDHLDWISLLKEKSEQLHPHPFYGSLLEVLHFYLNMERKRSETERHGSKIVH